MPAGRDVGKIVLSTGSSCAGATSADLANGDTQLAASPKSCRTHPSVGVRSIVGRQHGVLGAPARARRVEAVLGRRGRSSDPGAGKRIWGGSGSVVIGSGVPRPGAFRWHRSLAGLPRRQVDACGSCVQAGPIAWAPRRWRYSSATPDDRSKIAQIDSALEQLEDPGRARTAWAEETRTRLGRRNEQRFDSLRSAARSRST